MAGALPCSLLAYQVARDTLGFNIATGSRLSIVPFDTGPKRSMGHVPGAKKSNFLIRGAEADEATGPRIDRIPLARPPWWRRQYRELKKYFFSPPVSVPLISLDQ